MPRSALVRPRASLLSPLAALALTSCWRAVAPYDAAPGTDGASTDGAAPPPALEHVLDIAAGGFHTCARRDDGTAVCWGEDTHGQLGDGVERESGPPVAVRGLVAVSSLTVGDSHTCAVHSGGEVACWGWNLYGQTASPDASDHPLPNEVPGLHDAASIASDDFASCAVRRGGRVVCWGHNMFIQANRDTPFPNMPESTPFEVPGLSDAVRVLPGRLISIALRTGGGAVLWGEVPEVPARWNGDGTAVLTDFRPGESFTQLAQGARAGTCLLRTDGRVVCMTTLPVLAAEVPGLRDVTEIAGGGDHLCARRSNGTVACWGVNSHGQLGFAATDAMTLHERPVDVPGVTQATQLALGEEHSCARLADQTVVCWGFNNAGQLGDGTRTSSFVPVHVRGL